MAAPPPWDCDMIYTTYGEGLDAVKRFYHCHSKGPRAHHSYQRFRCPSCLLSIHLYSYNGRAFLRFPRRWPGAPKMETHEVGCAHVARAEARFFLGRRRIYDI